MGGLINPNDAAWLYAEKPAMPTHIGCLSIFGMPDGAGRTYLLEMAERFRRTRIFSRPFNYALRRSGAGRFIPIWDELEPDQIDLDYHFRHSALPTPGGERELGTLVSRLHSYPLDRTRPLWEMHLIEGLANDRFALYLKAHHALIDGVGGIRMLRRMLSDKPDAEAGGPPWALSSRSAASAPTETQREQPRSHLLAQASTQARSAVTAVRALAGQWSRRNDALTRPFDAPVSDINRRICGKRRFATQNYAFSRIKTVAEAADVSINDVFMALCSGALRRYLGELGRLPSKSLIAGMPVSFRSADDTAAGNAISFMLASLHTDIADPLERLHACHASASAAKAELSRVPAESMPQFTMMLMAPYMAQVMLGVGGYVAPMHNLIISNVPGPREALYLNGARLQEIYPISLLFNGEALNISVLSYGDRFNLGFTGCRDTLPHMQRVAVYTGETLAELERVLGLPAADGAAS